MSTPVPKKSSSAKQSPAKIAKKEVAVKKSSSAKKVAKPTVDKQTVASVNVNAKKNMNSRKLKKSAHQNYKPVRAEFPNGEVLEIMSTYGQENIKLDVAPGNHHAWVGGKKQVNAKDKSVISFNKRYSGISFTK